MTPKRIQLTLFVEEDQSREVERIRKEFNPKQFELIKSHVTLCRENELGQIKKIIEKLTILDHDYITIDFGRATRFSGGKGVLMAATGNTESFHKLRAIILEETNKKCGETDPHITLMHPRNSTCTDEIFEQIKKVIVPNKFEFRKVSLIGQDGKNKWNILQEFSLGMNNRHDDTASL